MKYHLLGAGVALGLLAPGSALALEAETFGQALKDFMTTQGVVVDYGSGIVAGDDVVLSDVSVSVSEMASERLSLGDLTFEDVSEEGDRYRIGRVYDADIGGPLPDIEAGRSTAYRVGLIEVVGLEIPKAGEEPVDLVAGAFYETLRVRDAAMLVDGEPFMAMDEFVVTSDLEATPMPTSVRLSGATIDISMPPDPGTQAFVAGTGYQAVTMDMVMEGTWDMASGALNMPTFTMAFEDMGTFEMSAEVAGYTADLAARLARVLNPEETAPNPNEAMAIMQELKLVTMTLTVEDEGFMDRLIVFLAEQQGLSREETVDGQAAQVDFLLGLLPPSPFSQDASQAARAFLRDPARLVLEARPATPVGVAEVMAAAAIDPLSVPAALGLDIRYEAR